MSSDDSSVDLQSPLARRKKTVLFVLLLLALALSARFLGAFSIPASSQAADACQDFIQTIRDFDTGQVRGAELEDALGAPLSHARLAHLLHPRWSSLKSSLASLKGAARSGVLPGEAFHGDVLIVAKACSETGRTYSDPLPPHNSGIQTTTRSTSGAVASLTTGERDYEPGDVVEVKLRNTSVRQIGSNLCFVRLEVKDGDSWRHIPHLGPNEACTSVQKVIPPGVSMKGQINLPGDLRSGTYRLSLDVEVGGDRRTVTSETFGVKG